MAGRRRAPRRASGMPVVTLSLMVATLLLVPAPASAAPPSVKKPPPPLTALWWQTFLGSSDPNSFDRCDLGTGDVVFLAGTTGGSATRSCTIPAGTSLLVPLINGECSEIEGNGETPAELRQCADDQADLFGGLSLVIDGVAVSDLTRLRVHSQVFQFTAVEGNVFDIGPGPSRSVADGYWALISPLAPGAHTISFGGTFDDGVFTTHATYNITVAA